MALICLGSIGAAPGVTTLSVLAAASWPRPAVLVEADPSGGVLAVRYRLSRSPGLAGLASVVRQGAPPEAIWSYAQALPGEQPVVVAPESGPVTHGILADAAAPLAEWCRSLEGVDVLVDCGRLGVRDVTWPLWAAADDLLLVARPRADELYPVAHRFKALDRHVGSLGLVLVGDRPYRPEEVSSQLGLPIRGVVADDARASGVLVRGGSGRTLRRSPLVRSVRTLVEGLARRHGVPMAEESPLPVPAERGRDRDGGRPLPGRRSRGRGRDRDQDVTEQASRVLGRGPDAAPGGRLAGPSGPARKSRPPGQVGGAASRPVDPGAPPEPGPPPEPGASADSGPSAEARAPSGPGPRAVSHPPAAAADIDLLPGADLPPEPPHDGSVPGPAPGPPAPGPENLDAFVARADRLSSRAEEMARHRRSEVPPPSAPPSATPGSDLGPEQAPAVGGESAFDAEPQAEPEPQAGPAPQAGPEPQAEFEAEAELVADALAQVTGDGGQSPVLLPSDQVTTDMLERARVALAEGARELPPEPPAGLDHDEDDMRPDGAWAMGPTGATGQGRPTTLPPLVRRGRRGSEATPSGPGEGGPEPELASVGAHRREDGHVAHATHNGAEAGSFGAGGGHDAGGGHSGGAGEGDGEWREGERG